MNERMSLYSTYEVLFAADMITVHDSQQMRATMAGDAHNAKYYV